MKIDEFRREGRLILHLQGRLDASWADFFRETLLGHIRRGEHHLVLHAEELEFLSSLGIRALMQISRELAPLGGSFQIVHASGMALEILEMAGLEDWISEETMDWQSLSSNSSGEFRRKILEHFALPSAAPLRLERVDAWKPWNPVCPEKCRSLSFDTSSYGLGIGGSGKSCEEARPHLGEFLALGGHLALQPPDERGRPDCLLREGDFSPSLFCAQALIFRGDFPHLMRFSPSEEISSYSLSALVNEMGSFSGNSSFAFVLLGEIEGLVGASLLRSPGERSSSEPMDFPEIREWLDFCGERAFPGESAAVAGIVHHNAEGTFSVHAHGAVFPFQILPNGMLHLQEQINRFFYGPPPKAVLHLVEDFRKPQGLGESAFLGGAAWWGPLEVEKEEFFA